MTLKCGIVDVGSNTMRLSIYQWEGERFRLLIHKKEMAGLAGYIQDGTMSSEGIECACGVLKQFQEILKNLNVHDMYVFGTAPLRNITNTETALDVIRSVTGLDVDVLSGAQEAHYSFVGATSCSDMRGSGLLTDIGGGSTELVSYENGVVTSECSLAIGSLSLHTTYVNGLFPTKAERKSIKERIRQELEFSKDAGIACHHLVGVGGTIRAAAKLCDAQVDGESHRRILLASDVKRLYKMLKNGDRNALQHILKTVPDRIHTVVPGLAILKTICKEYEVETISVSTCGVREGYLLEKVMGGQKK